MRKSLSSSRFFVQCLLGLLFGAMMLPDALHAQCGLSSFQGAGSPYTPGTAFANTQPLGSGEYMDFNVVSGDIYSFYCTPTRDATTSNYFDLTVSSTSAIISYNNSLTPLTNSWSGGACVSTPPVSSTDWFATYTGTVRINVKSWNAVNGCHDWVSGQGSTVLSYKQCVPTPDPGPGNSVWNVEAFATTDITLPTAIQNARWGTYVDNLSGTNFVSTNYWAQNSNPSTAPGWTGCQMPTNNFVMRARRQGFTCGGYTIAVNKAVNSIVILLNGTQIYSGSNISSAVTVGNYALSNSDLVEIRTNDICSTAGGVANVSIAPIAPTPAINAGTIGGVLNNSNICPGVQLGNFTNTASASGGVTGYNNGGAINYSWELSTDGGSTFNPVAGVTTSNWNSTTTVPAGSVYVIKRIATDECGNRGASNTITVTGRPAPNGSISPASQQICPGGSATLTFNFSPGTAPFNISYTNSLTTTSLSNLSNGSTTTVSPPSTVTYSYTSITDAYGCTTTSGFTGGALVIVSTPINISGVIPTNATCNGSSTGSITVNASGGVPPLMYSLNGGTPVSTNTFTNLPAGSYTATVTDSLGCSQTAAPVTIGQPTALSVSLAETDASCASVFDGTITVSASGGTPAYSYAVNGGPTQTNNVIHGLQTGYYVITTFDQNGCFDTMGINVGTQYAVTIDTLATSDITCYGSGNGSLSVQLSGGIQPYEYSINGITFQSSGSFTGLTAANYIVIGRDSKGCTQSVNVNITQPAQLVMIIDSVSNVLCASSATGNIYGHAQGGTPGYTYSWSNSQTTSSDLNVAGGTYNVTVTDANGCTAVNGATVLTPAVLSLNIALYNNPFCNGTSSGAILVTANGGIAPYAYSWSSGQTTQDIDSVPAGNYTVSVTDANGCLQTISQTLTDPAAISSSTTSTDVNCAGGTDGTASVTASGGTSPFTYLWSNFVVTPTVTGLAAGSYFVIVSDANNCQQRDSITISQPAPLVVTDTAVNISCFNANDGSITLTVSGGTQPYGFAWSNGATTQNLTNLTGGTYVCTVTDAHGCSVVITATIVNPAQIQPVFVVKNLSCFGDSNGVVNLTVSGGTPGYTYSWSPGGATTQNITNLTPGTYYVTITDARNCTTNDSATVTSPAALYTSGIIKNVSCNGLCDGYVFTTPYGGTLPYSFLWSHGPTTENVVQLCGGSYILTVTDANQCHVASLYIIHEPAVLADNITPTQNTCFGACNGALVSTPTGGTKPYQYLWSNFGTDSLQSGLCAGRYTLMLSDSNGCHLTDTISLTQPGQILVSGVVTNAQCNGSSTGGVVLTVSGGASPYTFAWTNGETTQNLTAAAAGLASVTVTDSHGCSQVANFNIGQPDSIHPVVSISQPRCQAGNDGFVSVDVTGGVSPYTFGWSTTPTQTGATATNMAAGTYTLTITDAVGCSLTVAATLNDPTPVTVTTQGANSRCYSNPNGGVIAQVSGGFPPYTYLLNGVYQTSDTFVGLAPNNYVLLVMDGNGCQATSSFIVRAVSTVSVSLAVSDQRILTGMETQLTATATSDTTIIHYFWTPGVIDSADVLDFASCPDTSNCSTPYVKPPFTQTFTVTVENADSCFASDTITVYVDNEPGSFMPTAFTPNGDGLNDRFALTFLGATKIEVTIYNRWGEKVYYNGDQTNSLNAADGWDGKDHGKDAPQDTYVYQANVTYFNGVVKNKTGTITLIR